MAVGAGMTGMTKEASVNEMFTYHKPEGDQPERYEKIRAKAKELVLVILECTPHCADQTVAVRKLREAVMTANAAIALKGLV